MERAADVSEVALEVLVATEEAVVMVVVVEEVLIRDINDSRRRNSWILAPLKISEMVLVGGV